MLIGGALAGVILVVAVLAIAGVFGGDGGSGATASDDSASTAAPSGDEDTASIPLRSVGGGDASGEVTIGLTTGEQGYIDVSVDRLEPPPNGQTYFVWFMQDRTRGYPYQPLRVQGNQGATARYALPNEVLGIIFSARSLDIWLAPTAELRQEIRGALQNAELVDVPGERILTAPLAGALDAAQGAGGSGDDSAG